MPKYNKKKYNKKTVKKGGASSTIMDPFILVPICVTLVGAIAATCYKFYMRKNEKNLLKVEEAKSPQEVLAQLEILNVDYFLKLSNLDDEMNTKVEEAKEIPDKNSHKYKRIQRNILRMLDRKRLINNLVKQNQEKIDELKKNLPDISSLTISTEEDYEELNNELALLIQQYKKGEGRPKSKRKFKRARKSKKKVKKNKYRTAKGPFGGGIGVFGSSTGNSTYVAPTPVIHSNYLNYPQMLHAKNSMAKSNPIKTDVIYTQNNTDDEINSSIEKTGKPYERAYFIVKNVEYAFPPCCYDDSIPAEVKNFVKENSGKNYYVTKIQQVDVNGKPIPNGVFTFSGNSSKSDKSPKKFDNEKVPWNYFLSRFKVYKKL